jgi:hypothetical protein
LNHFNNDYSNIIYAYSTPEIARHDNALKIGQTALDPARIDENLTEEELRQLVKNALENKIEPSMYKLIRSL